MTTKKANRALPVKGKSLPEPRKDKPVKEGERYMRVRQVEDWIAKGFPTSTIKRMIRTTFDLKTDVAVNKLFREAAQELGDTIGIETLRAVNQLRVEAMIEKDMAAGDHNTALKGIDLLNKMSGVYVEKREVKVVDKFEVVF